jgi:hypothetical protein
MYLRPAYAFTAHCVTAHPGSELSFGPCSKCAAGGRRLQPAPRLAAPVAGRLRRPIHPHPHQSARLRDTFGSPSCHPDKDGTIHRHIYDTNGLADDFVSYSDLTALVSVCARQSFVHRHGQCAEWPLPPGVARPIAGRWAALAGRSHTAHWRHRYQPGSS